VVCESQPPTASRRTKENLKLELLQADAINQLSIGAPEGGRSARFSSSMALPFFIFLQCLDVITTLVFLSKGVKEGNPLMSWALSNARSPWAGLVVTKMIAAFIGQYCYRSGRMTLLRRANVGYSLVVGWNLISIAAAAIGR
jgi:hypothetical protein